MKDRTIMALGESLGRIAKLDRDAAEAEHTDIGDIWDVLRFAQDTLREIAHSEFHVDSEAGDEPGEYTIDPPGAPQSDMFGKPKIDKVCETCGGDVSFEGWISWNVETQDFEVDDICDKNHHCKTCDGQVHAIDIEYKRYAMVIEVEGKEQTFKFHTTAEVGAFHYGLREGAKIGQWEVAYTDEETTCSDS